MLFAYVHHSPLPLHWYTGHFWSLSMEEHFYLLFARDPGSFQKIARLDSLAALKVTSGNKSSVISLSYQTESAKLSQDVLDAADLACDEHLRVHRTKGSQEFFVGQTKLLHANLAELESRSRSSPDTAAPAPAS